MSRRLTWQQLVLCYLGTVVVTTLVQAGQRREAGGGSAVAELRDGVLWGSLLFVIGFAWGSTCGYILEWMQRA